MFNIGPMELLVLAIVGLVVLGPDRLPGLARDAARMIRTLRELANGARTQLQDELGPELAHLADLDLRNLNPRTAFTRAVLGDTDLGGMNPANLIRDAFAETPTDKVVEQAPASPKVVEQARSAVSKPPPTPYDTDAT